MAVTPTPPRPSRRGSQKSKGKNSRRMQSPRPLNRSMRDGQHRKSREAAPDERRTNQFYRLMSSLTPSPVCTLPTVRLSTTPSPLSLSLCLSLCLSVSLCLCLSPSVSVSVCLSRFKSAIHLARILQISKLFSIKPSVDIHQ